MPGNVSQAFYILQFDLAQYLDLMGVDQVKISDQRFPGRRGFWGGAVFLGGVQIISVKISGFCLP